MVILSTILILRESRNLDSQYKRHIKIWKGQLNYINFWERMCNMIKNLKNTQKWKETILIKLMRSINMRNRYKFVSSLQVMIMNGKKGMLLIWIPSFNSNTKIILLSILTIFQMIRLDNLFKNTLTKINLQNQRLLSLITHKIN
jgi:hypothetical protein